MQEKDLHEPILSPTELTPNVGPNASESEIKDQLDVLAQYSNIHQNMKFLKDTQKVNILNEAKPKRPVKYAGFIDKFKRLHKLNNI